jgi:hypothetical protein
MSQSKAISIAITLAAGRKTEEKVSLPYCKEFAPKAFFVEKHIASDYSGDSTSEVFNCRARPAAVKCCIITMNFSELGSRVNIRSIGLF